MHGWGADAGDEQKEGSDNHEEDADPVDDTSDSHVGRTLLGETIPTDSLQRVNLLKVAGNALDFAASGWVKK